MVIHFTRPFLATPIFNSGFAYADCTRSILLWRVVDWGSRHRGRQAVPVDGDDSKQRLQPGLERDQAVRRQVPRAGSDPLSRRRQRPASSWRHRGPLLSADALHAKRISNDRPARPDRRQNRPSGTVSPHLRRQEDQQSILTVAFAGRERGGDVYPIYLSGTVTKPSAWSSIVNV